MTGTYVAPPRTEPRGRRRRDGSGAPLVRLTQPLVREHGALRPAGWDEALDRAATAIQKTVSAGGGRAVGMFSCSKATNEVNFLAQKFARAVVGTNNIDSCNRT